MTVFQMSDSDTKDDKYGPKYRARKQRRRSHVTEASQQALVEAKRLRHHRLLERRLQRAACDDAQRVAAESTPVMPERVPWNDGAPSCESDESNCSSDETSESSTGFETEAAVSVVAPAAMQRPPTRKELDNDDHIGKFMVYLTVPESNQASSNFIPSVVLAQIRGIRRDDAKLSYNVFDFSCNQDQAHLLTITDGHWDVARTKGRGGWNQDQTQNYCTRSRETKKFYALTKEQRAIMGRPKCWDASPRTLLEDKLKWINVEVNLVVCVLPRVTSRIIVSHGGYILSGTSSLIVSLLRASTHAHAVSFVESGKHERRKLTSNNIVEEKQKIFTNGPPRFPCGVTSCPAVFRYTYQANQHMQYHHALGPDDSLLIRRMPNSRVKGKFPCRFLVPGSDPCEFRSFKLKTSANQHMQTSHGLLSGDNRLY